MPKLPRPFEKTSAWQRYVRHASLQQRAAAGSSLPSIATDRETKQPLSYRNGSRALLSLALHTRNSQILQMQASRGGSVIQLQQHTFRPPKMKRWISNTAKNGYSTGLALKKIETGPHFSPPRAITPCSRDAAAVLFSSPIPGWTSGSRLQPRPQPRLWPCLLLLDGPWPWCIACHAWVVDGPC